MEVGKKARVKGLAIEAGQSRNKIMYTSEELAGGSETLAGVTIIKDHEATTDNSIGIVDTQSFVNGQQSYGGWVEEDGTNVVQKIRDKRLKVSVGAMVKKLVREKEDDDFLVAKGIHYMELSTTPTPGVASASITTDEGKTSEIVECIDMKQLQSSLSEEEIAGLLETCNILGESENNKRGESTMTDEDDKAAADKAAADKVAADKVASDKAASDKAAADKTASDKAEADKVAADKTAADKAATEKIVADKAIVEKLVADKVAADKVAAEKLVTDKAAVDKTAEEKTNVLLKEIQTQKDKIVEMEKLLGATKGQVDNGSTDGTLEVTDHYACESSKTGKYMTLFMMPNADGSFPIKRGD